MSGLRPKPAARIRDDALAIARRKLAAGCQPCADAYLDLARRSGATDAQIREALGGETGKEPVGEQGR